MPEEQVEIKTPDGSFLTTAENEESCLAVQRKLYAGRGNVYSKRVKPATVTDAPVTPSKLKATK